MLFVFVVLAIGSLALAGFGADPSGAGTGTAQVIETGSDPFGANLPEEPPADETFGTTEVGPPAAGTPSSSPSPDGRQEPRQVDRVAADGPRGAAKTAPRPVEAATSATPTTASSPAAPPPRRPPAEQPAPPPAPAPSPADPAPPPPEPTLLERLLGAG
jgi:hypothetical protein